MVGPFSPWRVVVYVVGTGRITPVVCGRVWASVECGTNPLDASLPEVLLMRGCPEPDLIGLPGDLAEVRSSMQELSYGLVAFFTSIISRMTSRLLDSLEVNRVRLRLM